MNPNPPPRYLETLVPEVELRTRAVRFQVRLLERGLDGALITHNSGLYYLAGTLQPAQLYVPAEGEPRLLVRRNAERAELESPWPITPLRSMRRLSETLHGVGARPRRLGLELDVMPVLTYQRYQQALPEVEWEDVGAMLRRLRAIKSVWEIGRIRAVRPLADAMLEAIPELLEPGIPQIVLAARLEAFARERGHQGRCWLRGYNMEMYWGHLVAGEAGSVGSFFDSPNGGWGLFPGKPDGPSREPIERDSPVMIDYVAARDGYCLDHSRTAVIGALPEPLARAYEGCLAVQETVVSAMRPGALGSDLWEMANTAADYSGIADGFGGRGDNRVRFVGHGIGLEIDELPLIAAGWNEPLKTGMVVAVEPKYVHPTLGMVGIENSWLITDDGAERLTSDGDAVIEIN